MQRYLFWSAGLKGLFKYIKRYIKRERLVVNPGVNSFAPKFLKWPFAALYLDTSTVANGGVSKNNKNRMANGVDPDEKACYELSSGSDCLQRYLFWSERFNQTKDKKLATLIQNLILGADLMTAYS